METNCVYIPETGSKTFLTLLKTFGRSTAKFIYYIAVNPEFQDEYRKSLTFEEGFPTAESLLNNERIQELIGDATVLLYLNRNNKPIANSIDSFTELVKSSYMDNNSLNKKYITVVTYDLETNTILKQVVEKTPETEKVFKDLYSAIMLNDRMGNILAPVGVNVGILTELELRSGRVGITDFSLAKLAAEGFAQMIRVANGIEGVMALPEENAHTIIRALKDEPLISRLLNLIRTNNLALALIDDYDAVVAAYENNEDLIIEEAAGRLLRDRLLAREEGILFKQPIVDRAINWIKSKLKQISASEIDRAIAEVLTEADSFVKRLYSNELTITRKLIELSFSTDKLNALTKNLDAKITKAEELFKAMSKKYYDLAEKPSGPNNRISSILLLHEDLNASRLKVLDPLLKAITQKNAEVAIGLFIKLAYKDLESIRKAYKDYNNLSKKDLFYLLRTLRDYITCYGPFIEELRGTQSLEEEEFDINVGDGLNPVIKQYSDVLSELSKAISSMSTEYYKLAEIAFMAVAKPFFPAHVVIKDAKSGDLVYTLEELMKLTKDISALDLWLDSAAESSDTMILVFDAMIREAKENRRLRTTDFIHLITVEARKLEKAGVNDFSWIYERDSNGKRTGNFISEYNLGLFYLDKRAFLDALNKQYPDKNTNPSLRRSYNKEWKEWRRLHCARVRSIRGGWYYVESRPNDNYLSELYKTIMKDSAKKEFYDFIMINKEIMDMMLPLGSTYLLNSIRIKKSTLERMKRATKEGNLESFLKETWKDKTQFRSDDDTMGISISASEDFEGNRILKLPIYYLRSDENDDLEDLSDDVVSTMILYANMAFNYDELSLIVNQIETGKLLLLKKRKTLETVGGVPLVKKTKTSSGEHIDYIYKNQDIKWIRRLQGLIDNDLYGETVEAAGAIGKTNYSTVKVTRSVLRISSLALLGFNILAGTANLATGLCMLNIEAAAGEFFHKDTLKKADEVYFSEIGNYLDELESRTHTSKLYLVMLLLDIKLDYDNTLREIDWQNKLFVTRFFGVSIAYICQTGGDHWLYNRAAIAQLLETKVKKSDGTTTNLWDAMKPVPIDPENPDLGMRIEIEGDVQYEKDLIHEAYSSAGVKNEGGTKGLYDKYQLGRVKDLIDYINEHCFGVYHLNGASLASRHVWASFLLLYRKWIKPLYNYRFMEQQVDLRTGKVREGYWRTSYRFIGNLLDEMKNGLANILARYDKLENWEKENVKRTMAELILFGIVASLMVALTALVKYRKGKKDDEEDTVLSKAIGWGLNFGNYATTRLFTELGSLVPIVNIPEGLKILNAPAAAASTIKDTIVLYRMLLPWNYFDELQSGKYKGHSTAWKTFWNSPIVPALKSVYRFFHPEESLSFFNT